ncbi:hypothetical protein BOX15_Mlig010699g3 [Macrostomum lignano]|uniref:SH3 domain-containing protein n=1 Tax=Macrostomum lignano TaxID=282301 RepID=A0A267E272_9PLAT|nr:hypothetical protein BOX15_Mlig010699g3 [Macrostomum lignano]
MPKFSQISERFQRLKAYWEDLGASSTSPTARGAEGYTGFGSTHRLAPAGGSLRKYSNHATNSSGDQRPQHEMVASTDCLSGQYGNSELVRALGPSKGARASGRGTVKQGIRKRFEIFEDMASNGGLDSRKGSFSDETKAERAEIFLRYQAEKLQDRSKYKSVFYDRVGPEFEDPTARLSALQTSDSEGDLHENHGSAATTSATSVGATNNRSSALRLAEQSGNLSDESQQPQPQDQRGGELAGRLTSSGPSRTLWRNMPEVAEAGLLESLSKDEVKLKEAQFEFITSEASYYKNLLVLVDVFYNSSLFDHTRQNALVKALDKHHLFSNIVDIIECSTSFLKAMEEQWKKSPRMEWISQVILDSIESLKVYKDYCRNFYYQTKTLHKLCENADFVNELGELEQRPDCRRIALQSYLEMPMKRVMSLQLLMDAVVRRMSQDDPNYGASMLALGQLLTLARECDQESRMMSEKEQMLKLQNQLIFTKVKAIGCWGGGRHLIREAQVRVISATPNTQGFVAKMFLRKNYLQLHAFSDLLIVSKPKSDQGFQVLKHCPRAYVDVEYLSNASYSTFDESSQKPTLRLRMVDSSDGTPPVSLVLEMPSREEAERWLMIFSPRDELGDPVYEPDDCPQAEAIRAYTAQQKDDLELRRGDIVNIYKKTEDGWYLGSRLTQLGHRGWFPANHVREIENEHYKAKLKKVSFRRKSAVAAYARHKHL